MTLVLISVCTQVLPAHAPSSWTASLLASLCCLPAGHVCVMMLVDVAVRQFKLFACRYVQQDDILPGTSTVWEYLRFHAKLRMGAFSSQGIEQQAWSVIQLLGRSEVSTASIMFVEGRARWVTIQVINSYGLAG